MIFNTIFFVASGTDHAVSVWISYGFIHFAYLMLLVTPKLIRGGKSSAVFGFSLYSISSVYFLVELVIGVVFILTSPESYKAALLVQVCLAGLYGIILIANLIANEHTADAEEERQYQIDYVKKASAEIKILLDRISDKEAKKKVEKVYDALYSSPVKSHPSIAQMENRILESIDELQSAVQTGDNVSIISLADSLLGAVNERNMRLKTLD
jgi:hypothetical protein